MRINRTDAEFVLRQALALAQSDGDLPVIWTSHTRSVFGLDEMTWTPALATMLLAKAVDDEVDAFSLKAGQPGNPRAYSARVLCHGVLVPAAVKYGFSIRNTGAEPLNNSPFNGADRLQDIERRASKISNYRFFYSIAEQADLLDRTDALEALAAFLREALSVAAVARSVVVKADGLNAWGARVAVKDYLRFDADDRPRRLQAFAAACLDLAFEDVRSRRLNDPSRDIPGDVHAMGPSAALLAVEVRGKKVGPQDLISFANACQRASIGRALMLADSPGQMDLAVHVENSNQRSVGTLVEVYTSAPELLSSAFLWAPLPLDDGIAKFSSSYLMRLKEIEVGVGSLQEWSRAVAIAQNR
jgi:hypothetical protein